jgi:hypothetical protein
MAKYHHKEVGHKHNGEHHSKIHEHHTTEHANMPTEVKIEDWAGPVPGMLEDYNDSVSGIDEQISKDNIKHSHIKPRKA